MAYCLEPGESAGDGLKRVVREEIDAALAGIATSTGSDRDEAIHEARKSIKKIRAVLRLVRHRAPDLYRREVKRLRAMSERLSGLRDAAAMIEAFDLLVESTRKLRAVREGLIHRRDRAVNHATVDDTLKSTVSGFTKMKRRTDGWSLHVVKIAGIEPGIEKSWRRSRRLWKLARKHPDPVVWHEFRKRVKDYWFHLRLLENAANGEMAQRTKQFEELEEGLGDDHNLVVLNDILTLEPARFGGERTVARALDLIGKNQRKLRARSLALGSKLYGNKEPLQEDYGAN